MTQNSKKDDVVTYELKKGFQWATHHTKIVITLIALFFITGIGISAQTYFHDKSEDQAQEAFYNVEKDYLKAKTNNTELTQKANELVNQLGQVINQHADSQAAKLAGLTIAEIATTTNQIKKEDVSASLDKVKTSNDLLSAAILDKKATLKSDLGDCKSAIGLWDSALKIKDAQFMAAELNLKKGLCYEALNDFAQAKSMYQTAKSSLAEGQQQSATAKTAERLLKLLDHNAKSVVK